MQNKMLETNQVNLSIFITKIYMMSNQDELKVNEKKKIKF